ncbi:hypothetical protein [Limosilactobacillus kribbianus]|uniref:hypothetical protein n=1 Tax=Limosilactobacillus kribbianus TaxID=2982695 RepID=UPI002264EB10|nr:hypothetical protein [Limosilactobacillus kribbianus]
MIKVTKKLLNTSLALLLALGISGCAATNQTYTHKTSNEPTSAKTVKQSSAQHKAATKESKQATKKSSTTAEATTSTANESSSAATAESAPTAAMTTAAATPATTNQGSVTAQQQSQAAAATTYQQSKGNATTASQTPAVTTTAPKSTTSATTGQQQIQLGLGDVAVWTDSYGITHHVDSDGMDRQTIAGSSQVNYEDWSGPLPTDAQVIHNGEEPSEQIQLGLGDVAVWTDSYGITHHVDSDGMDRQTIDGSSEIHYEDWYGSLPTNAQVIHSETSIGN